MFDDPLITRIAEFLVEIGIPVEASEVPEGAFLPGLAVENGRLQVDEARLAHPGDLLHEAGHIAVAPGWARERLSGEVAVPGVDMKELEFAAIPWSYAAARAIGIDPAVVFHEHGYQGRSAGLLANFELGVPIGVHLLEDAGIAYGARRADELGVDPYPHMVRWLRE